MGAHRADNPESTFDWTLELCIIAAMQALAKGMALVGVAGLSAAAGRRAACLRPLSSYTSATADVIDPPPPQKVPPPLPCCRCRHCCHRLASNQQLARPLLAGPSAQIKVALCQLAVGADKQANLTTARSAIEEAATAGAGAREAAPGMACSWRGPSDACSTTQTAPCASASLTTGPGPSHPSPRTPRHPPTPQVPTWWSCLRCGTAPIPMTRSPPMPRTWRQGTHPPHPCCRQPPPPTA